MALELDSYRSIPEAFYKIANKCPQLKVYTQSVLIRPTDNMAHRAEALDRVWQGRTFSEVVSRVNKIAKFLESIGVVRGDKIAILSNSRPEWMEGDIATLSVGGVVVSVYQSLMENDVGYILFDSDSRVVFVENQEQLDKIIKLLETDCPIPATEDRSEKSVRLEIKKIISFELCDPHPLVVSLDSILSGAEVKPPKGFNSLRREDLASLVYTSGTTGPPKGVMQTHGNHLANVRQAYQAKLFNDKSSIMLVLPLAHSFAKLMGNIGFLTEAIIKFPAVIDKRSSKFIPGSVTRDIREASAQLVPLVPRMLEKMKDGISLRLSKRNPIAFLLRAAIWSGKERAEALESKNSIPLLAGLTYFLTRFLRKTVKKKIFGKNFGYVVSGGAKLPVSVAQFFTYLGITILEGYGLTETCVATNVNRIDRKKIGTVGPLLADDIELKIATDGEILFRGPNITKGYYNRPTATRNSWDSEGWFHTGDLGSLDQEGFLSITGRKKELLVTAGGKKIAPDSIETKLRGINLVSQAVLVGEGKPYICALITPNPDAIITWANSQSFNIATNDGPEKDAFYDKLKSEIWKEIEKINHSLASFESIKKILLIQDDFTIENGLLTPTFKVKRNEVYRRFADKIEELFEK